MTSFTQEITDQRREQLVVHEVNKILKSEWKPTVLEGIPPFLDFDKLNREVSPDEAEMKFKVLPYSSQLEKDIAERVRTKLSEITSRLDKGIYNDKIDKKGKIDWDKQSMVLLVPTDIKPEWALSPEIQIQ